MRRALVLATLTAFDARPETGRVDSHDDSVRVASILEEVYRPRTAALTHVPEMPVEERVEMMLRLVRT